MRDSGPSGRATFRPCWSVMRKAVICSVSRAAHSLDGSDYPADACGHSGVPFRLKDGDEPEPITTITRATDPSADVVLVRNRPPRFVRR